MSVIEDRDLFLRQGQTALNILTRMYGPKMTSDMAIGICLIVSDLHQKIKDENVPNDNTPL